MRLSDWAFFAAMLAIPFAALHFLLDGVGPATATFLVVLAAMQTIIRAIREQETPQ